MIIYWSPEDKVLKIIRARGEGKASPGGKKCPRCDIGFLTYDSKSREVFCLWCGAKGK